MTTFELLETMKWSVDGGYVLRDRHLARLRESAGFFGFPFSHDAARTVLDGAVAQRSADARVRLLLNASGATRCELTDLDVTSTTTRAALASSPVSSRDVFLRHKTTHRAVYDDARRSRPEVDAVILWNEAGEITEATDFNVVIELDGRRVTPPVACGLLAGTMRAELLDRGEIVEQRISKEDLLAAPRVWLINSVRGWMEAEIIRDW